ncbi:MAG: tRNA 4-thiouridine(8) synthase ThiI [Parcubacteria group bacterium CG10_big_fil_rev_8_21_14_0_10_36_14]|nr:MAG: tRNA 4-thiouridine(8) synthase ThiI [Parcubacteria group bacterium CG10_big_fil_rev_8_21_14_0_10_36_14]
MTKLEKVILVHYHEIALKGRNRPMFEDRLVRNIKKMIGAQITVKRLSGRIEVCVPEAQIEKALKKMSNIFGISGFSKAVVLPTDFKKIKSSTLKLLSEDYSLKDSKKTFKVVTKRGYKQFPKNSMEISAEIGAYILKNSALKVDIKKPKIIINVELLKDRTYIYTKKMSGQGGLPIGVSGKMLVLISGGIDSPVASYFMAKRGAELFFLHFHSYPYTDKASIEKVQEILHILSDFGINEKNLCLAPIIDFQKEVVKKVNQKYRIIIYRRLMYKVAEALAKQNRWKALISGDNLGQVASQTIENMAVIGVGIDLPIMRPLVGFDKEEIIDFAKRIGTFETSILPHGDCCSVFLPKNPATKTRITDILIEEKAIGMDKWVEKIIRGIKY